MSKHWTDIFIDKKKKKKKKKKKVSLKKEQHKKLYKNNSCFSTKFSDFKNKMLKT